jgi:hypothetical protein
MLQKYVKPCPEATMFTLEALLSLAARSLPATFERLTMCGLSDRLRVTGETNSAAPLPRCVAPAAVNEAYTCQPVPASS